MKLKFNEEVSPKMKQRRLLSNFFLELFLLIFKTQGWSTVTTLAGSKHPSIILLFVTMTT